ncbi:hypothetical protein ABZ016_31655 [Streptomyces sp. NPDC006372]|uniref:hypothetical protein n=1 Tax=Streptomyces sp. NPDC006372 TaxID=3155599 RepID=UPI0033B1F616
MLDMLRTQLTVVQALLAEARTRAEAAEADRDCLADQVESQRHRLEHAAAYGRELERDLIGRQDIVTALLRENEVLRRQAQRLLNESADAVPVFVTAPSPQTATHAQDGVLRAVPAGLPMPDWQPSTVEEWRPKAELPYPQSGRYHDPIFEQQRDRCDALDAAWAELKRDLRAVRRRLRVPFHVRSPGRVMHWLHQSTSDARWLMIGESVEMVQHYDKGYRRSDADPDVARVGIVNPPEYELTMGTVNAYRDRVARLRTDLIKLTDLHAERLGLATWGACRRRPWQ